MNLKSPPFLIAVLIAVRPLFQAHIKTPVIIVLRPPRGPHLPSPTGRMVLVRGGRVRTGRNRLDRVRLDTGQALRDKRAVLYSLPLVSDQLYLQYIHHRSLLYLVVYGRERART